MSGWLCMDKKLRISGNVVGELSDKIPTNIIALNELIKNAYDAGAKEVNIELNTHLNKLTISDNGFGMDDTEIDVLLHVAKSSKQYGSYNENTKRFIQGSKGLGFLSVFKFGDQVTWKTTKNEKLFEFSINYQDLLKLDDLSQYAVRIAVEQAKGESGTTIEIILRSGSASNYLENYLLDSINRDKILNAFIDSAFIINLNINGTKFKTKSDLSLDQYYRGYQLFHVKFSSTTKQICFTYKNHPVYGKTINCVKTEIYNSNIDSRFRLDLDLMIFDFSGIKRKSIPELDQLFIINPDKLTPLIYVNKNLFSNFSLFDPDILRYSQSAKSLPQMIGYVEILSNDSNIQFNSDRTQFQENDLTESIRSTLEALNKQIQKSGSDFKTALKKTPKIVPPPAGGKRPIKPILKVHDITVETISQPISKEEFISIASDSHGDKVPLEKILFEVDGEAIDIIGSIFFPCEKECRFSFEDPSGIIVADSARLIVVERKKPLEAKQTKPVLISNRARANYYVEFRNNPITALLEQLNSLYEQTETKYFEVIACSLRALYELAVFELEISGLIKYEPAKKHLHEKVTGFIELVKNNAKLLTEISIGLGKSSYVDFVNELTIIDFDKSIRKCHLGAHKSTNSLTQQDLESVGKEVALFLVIVNELLNNAKTKPDDGHPYIISIK